MIDTIKNLSRKLAALAAEDSGATDNEREVALQKLQALLQKHSLTMADLEEERLIDIAVTVADKSEEMVFFHCGFFILDVSSVTARTRKAGKQIVCTIPNVTLVQAADIDICFSYYLKMYRESVDALKRERDQINAAIRVAPKAFISKFKIFPASPSEGKGKDLTPKEIRALMRAMSGMKGSQWSKPNGNVTSDSFILTNS